MLAPRAGKIDRRDEGTRGDFASGRGEEETIHQHAFADLGRHVAGLRRPRLVSVDGAGGSGKSAFAARLMAAAQEYVTTAIVPVDDVYRPAEEQTPAYEGLFDLSRLRTEVVEPYVAGRPIAYRPYDWENEELSLTARAVGHVHTLIIEGVLAISATAGCVEVLGVWVDVPAEVRLARGLERDGEAARDVWENDWMLRKDAYRREERPDSRAHLTVDTTAPLSDERFLCRGHGAMDLRALRFT
jgi:uridine kinase